MKKALICFLTAVMLFTCVACASQVKPEDIAGKTYRWEKDGFGGKFTITLNEDGTMSYYVGMLSSYIGMGTWNLEKDVLTLTDRPMAGIQYINRFRIEDGALVFIEEGSTDFMYVDVVAGDRFFEEKE